MKVYLHLIFLIYLLNLYSCKEPTKETKVVETEKETEIKKADSISTESNIDTKKIVPQKHYKHFFVSAKSGLNYRNKPKGEILGKFHLNTLLKVIESPKIIDQITENNKILKGEWLGVEKEMDTVYVFSGFLSESFTYSEIQLFYASPYYKTENELRNGFVNLSERYPFDYDNEISTVIPEEALELGKKVVLFNKKQKNKILKNLNYSKNDTLFIYNLNTDSIYKFKLENLTTVAHLNMYRIGETNLKEYEYEIGLNTTNKYKTKGESLAYIGKLNPFQTGKITPIIWDEIDNQLFPMKRRKVENAITPNTYTFTYSNFEYFIQINRFEKEKSSKINSFHLIIVDTVTDSLIYRKAISSGESTYIPPLQTTDAKKEHGAAWTGEIFKNKPPIIYGLENIFYSCPVIDFISKKEPPVRISCDTRD